MEKKTSPFKSPKAPLMGLRDDRPWNNSLCRLLHQSRSEEKLRKVLATCQTALARLYEACTSDEVMSHYWDLQAAFVCLGTSLNATLAFVAMAEEGKTRDIGVPLLANGFPYFSERCRDIDRILKGLARPCSSMPRDVFSRLSSAIAELKELHLYLKQETRRKRSKKNRNQGLYKGLDPKEEIKEDTEEYPSSDPEKDQVKP